MKILILCVTIMASFTMLDCNDVGPVPADLDRVPTIMIFYTLDMSSCLLDEKHLCDRYIAFSKTYLIDEMIIAGNTEATAADIFYDAGMSEDYKAEFMHSIFYDAARGRLSGTTQEEVAAIKNYGIIQTGTTSGTIYQASADVYVLHDSGRLLLK